MGLVKDWSLSGFGLRLRWVSLISSFFEWWKISVKDCKSTNSLLSKKSLTLLSLIFSDLLTSLLCKLRLLYLSMMFLFSFSLLLAKFLKYIDSIRLLFSIKRLLVLLSTYLLIIPQFSFGCVSHWVLGLLKSWLCPNHLSFVQPVLTFYLLWLIFIPCLSNAFKQPFPSLLSLSSFKLSLSSLSSV